MVGATVRRCGRSVRRECHPPSIGEPRVPALSSLACACPGLLPPHRFPCALAAVWPAPNTLRPYFIFIHGHTGQHVGHETSRGGSQVDVIADGLESHTEALQRLKQRCKPCCGPAKSVDSPDNQFADLPRMEVPLESLPRGAIHGLPAGSFTVPLDRVIAGERLGPACRSGTWLLRSCCRDETRT